MTASQVDPRPHSDAVIALLEAALPDNCHAYRDDRVPGSPRNPIEPEREKPLPEMFVIVTVQPRYVPPVGLGARSRRGAWRIAVRCVGSSVNECGWIVAEVSGVLRNGTYVVDGTQVSTFFESAQDPTPDTGRYSSLVVYTANH